MRIAIFGLGHVGLTTAACFAHLGHEVVGTDDDVEKVRTIGRGESPFFEPGLPELLRAGLEAGGLRVTERAAEAAGHGEIVFICVGTPIRESGEPNLVSVERVARAVAPNLSAYAVLTEKSTVPVGTGDRIRRTAERAGAAAAFDVASNPEFLREGQAVADTLRPNRVVVGASNERAHEALRRAYEPLLGQHDCPYIATDIATAELIKLASNAFLATKVSFINAVADVCEAAGADVAVVAMGMGMDPRIGAEYLQAGIGYGGYCLPKDLAAFRYKAQELGVDFGLLDEVARVNRARPPALVLKVREVLWNLEDKRIAVWGLAFKAGTDDLRESPALDVVSRLLAEGASVAVHDPVALPAARSILSGATAVEDPFDAAEGAHAVVIATDWDDYRTADLERLKAVMAEPVIVDGRDVLDPGAVTAAGFIYASVGRPTLYPRTPGGSTHSSPGGATGEPASEPTRSSP